MGIPTNQTKGQGCNPVSSNCVIWQGPDIPCIDLCHGDSVSDVVFKLATELCSILDTLNIDTYDLTCFEPICPKPENFHDLIQFLITKICELQCCCDGTTPAQSACPDACIVNVASCFYFQNQLGDTITTMTLPDYVTAIGNKLCQLIAQLAVDTARIGETEDQIVALGQRVTEIEDELPNAVVVLPTSCLLGPPPVDGWPIATVVQNLETEFCQLKQATGSPIELLQAIQQQCANMDNLQTLANRNSNYGSIFGWVTAENYQNVADSLNNMWLTICDMRAAVENILKTCCCTDCDDVDISFTATVEGTILNLFFNGSFPSGMTDCFPSGNLITITDTDGGTFVTYVEVINNVNGSASINLNGTPVNPALDLTVTIQGCWNRPAPGSDCGGLRCERVLTYIVVNTAPCPTLVIVPGVTTIDYSFTNNVNGPVTYDIELYTLGNVFVASQTHTNPVYLAAVNGQFTGLIGGSNYYITVVVTVNGNQVTCPQAFVNTLPYPCAAPTDVSAIGITT